MGTGEVCELVLAVGVQCGKTAVGTTGVAPRRSLTLDRSEGILSPKQTQRPAFLLARSAGGGEEL